MRERLRGSEPLELPTDRARPVALTKERIRHRFDLSSELVQTLKEQSAQLGATVQEIFLAAFQILLGRLCGQGDFVLGALLNGVAESEFAGSPSVRLLRAALGDEQSFARVIERMRAACAAAESDPELEFADLVEKLGVTVDASRRPIYQALFCWGREDARADGFAAPDLTLFAAASGEFEIEYASQLFEPVTIERTAANFCTLLESIARDPNDLWTRLPLVHADELSLLDRMNETRVSLPPLRGGFHELIRLQSERAPLRTAVIDGEGSQSYGELNARAEFWAQHLCARGVSRGTRVGVAIGRNRRALEVMLGVLKSGAAYVPLDTSSPLERLAFMIDDADLACVVTEQVACERVPATGVPLLVVELLEEEALAGRASLPIVNEPDDIAYIIYTSGSTGRPKGVEVPHSAVLNMLVSAQREPGISSDDRVLAVSTFSFDISIIDLFLPLTVGACTMLGPRQCAADGATLARYIEEFEATFVQATPTTFSLLVQAGLPRRRFKALGGGEPFPAQLARDLAPCCDEIWNGYGPTEATVYASFYRIVDPSLPVLIGRPIANAQMYVLDPQGQRVPFGVAGELYIGGHGVARGYRKRPELTEERFLPDPFSTEPSARMYRTGDVVRVRERGVQYVGRSDHQVKLRGYRIELGEIEGVLVQHPAVEACAVVVSELGAGDQRLAAYFVRSAGEPASRAELSAHLARQLPSYMVPRLIVELDALPMTPSGKIDRKLLPDPRGHELVQGEGSTLASNATERALLDVWKQVLGVAGLGTTDDFFAVGGHSLLAVRLVHELNKAFCTSLALGLVFEAPTVREQAERIDHGAHGGGLSAIPLKRDGKGEPLFCICGINLYQALAEHIAVDRPVFGLFLPIEGELFESDDIQLDTRDMARQYLTVLRELQPHGPYHLTGVSFGGMLAYEIARQLRQSGEEVALLALLDVTLPTARLGFGARSFRGAVRRVSGRVPHYARRVASYVKRRLSSAPPPPAKSESASTQVARKSAFDLEALRESRQALYRRAMDGYAADMPTYDGDALLVRARAQVERMPGCAADYGWSRYVKRSLSCVDVPGDHLGILAEPNVQRLAAVLRAFL